MIGKINNFLYKIKYQYFYLKLKENFMRILYKSVLSEFYIKQKFVKRLGYYMCFNKIPITFNQKIQFRKLYDNNSLYSICADKYKVRDYVREKVGEKYLIPLYLVTDNLTLEQWEKLPNSFVAKANHNSGPVQIVRNKFEVNAKKIIKELNNQLKTDYGILSMEKYYSDIPRKIVVEKFLKENIEDYKFHCFKEKIFLERITREGLGSMYNIDNWENLGFSIGYDVDIHLYEKPKNFEDMIKLARKLSEDFDYVRVDLYNVDGQIYFGELTFCESGGFGKFTDEKWDYKFGSYWNQKKLKW